MWDKFYGTSERQDRCKRSWLAKPVGAYLQELADKGYQNTTLRIHTDNLLKFGEFLEQRGARSLADLPDWIEAFLRKGNQNIECVRNRRSVLTGFIRHLRSRGLVPPCPTPAAASQDERIGQYVRFLREHRGVCAEYAKHVTKCCEAFLAYVAGQRIRQLKAIEPKAIHQFITHEGNRYRRKTMGNRCSVLRGFLRYLHRQGIVPADLSRSVVAPHFYKHEECPRFITREQTRAVLEAVDRGTRQGRRDYAMMLILATYGVRGIEVVRLQMKDIDWRAEQLHIRLRKAGNSTVYPLAPCVGDAILAYLQNDRPKSRHPEVFLSCKAPFRPLVYAAGLGYLARRYMAEAGVQVDRAGTHTFRYSCAQRLLDQQVPLKHIGDYLGHSDLNSTLRYTKMAIEPLRDIALGDGEDLL
jgi:integrase/recombinase XerD